MGKHLLGKKASGLELDLIKPLERLANAPGLVQMLLGQVLVVSLGVDDVADLKVGPRTDQGRRGEVEHRIEAAYALLDVVGLEEGVGHAEEGGVPRVARAGHDDGRWGVTRQDTTGRTPAHPTFRILNLQYYTTLAKELIYTGNRQIKRI